MMPATAALPNAVTLGLAASGASQPLDGAA
jgi:hypothetical protein